MPRWLAPLALPIILSIGWFSGDVVYEKVLARATASVRLPVSWTLADLTALSAVTPALQSIDEFRNFGDANNLRADQVFQKVENALRGKDGAVAFKPVNRISKKDIKDIPEAMLKYDTLGAPDAISDLEITAKAKTEELAKLMASMGMSYCRQVLANHYLTTTLEHWKHIANIGLAASQEEEEGLRVELKSTERKLASMEKIRDKYKDSHDAIDSSFDTQVIAKDVLGLTPLQQIVALESEKSNHTERIRRVSDERERWTVLHTFAERFVPKLSQRPRIQNLLGEMDQAIAELKAAAGQGAGNTKLGIEQLNVAVATAKARYFDSGSTPASPEILGNSPMLSNACKALGLLFAAAAWLLTFGGQYSGTRLFRDRLFGPFAM